MPSGPGMLSARLHGAWDNRALDYDATVQLDGTALRITYDASAPQVIDLTIDRLRGAVLAGDTLALHVSGGSTVVLSGSPHLDGLRNRLEAAVCVFPAQTLSLRGFGSESSAPGSDHDRWFDALLTARRVSEESRTVETQRRAFDAPRLARHAQLTRDAWAATRSDDAADRRALVTELEEIALPYTTALRQLEHAALRLKQVPDEVQFDVWRRWTGMVQRSFCTADEAWTLMVPVLCDPRGSAGALWRRLLGRRKSGGGS